MVVGVVVEHLRGLRSCEAACRQVEGDDLPAPGAALLVVVGGGGDCSS